MSVSDLSVSPLQFQSAESRGWAKGLYLPTGRGGMGSHMHMRGGIGQGRRRVETRWSEECSLERSACTLLCSCTAKHTLQTH